MINLVKKYPIQIGFGTLFLVLIIVGIFTSL